MRRQVPGCQGDRGQGPAALQVASGISEPEVGRRESRSTRFSASPDCFPLAVPSVFPDKVAALFVYEGTDTIVRGARTSTPRALPGLSAFNAYQGDIGDGDFSVSGKV